MGWHLEGKMHKNTNFNVNGISRELKIYAEDTAAGAAPMSYDLSMIIIYAFILSG